jgi:hypothetical protein
MADVTRVHGDPLGVVAVDASKGDTDADGVLDATLTVANVGRSCAWLAIIVKNGSSEAVDLQAEVDTGDSVEAILKAVQASVVSSVQYGGEILAYQVQDDAYGQVSVMVAGSNWTSATLQTAIRALGATVGNNSVDVSGSTVTDTGMKLATS